MWKRIVVEFKAGTTYYYSVPNWVGNPQINIYQFVVVSNISISRKSLQIKIFDEDELVIQKRYKIYIQNGVEYIQNKKYSYCVKANQEYTELIDVDTFVEREEQMEILIDTNEKYIYENRWDFIELLNEYRRIQFTNNYNNIK